MILSTAYCPPLEFFTILSGNSSVCIDSSERYQKQSWRNRCRILTANGPMDLRFPIVHNGRYGITEVLVDYSVPWVAQTEYAVRSAYGNSPFFEYYRDEFFGILDSKPATLWDLNARLIAFFCRKIGLPVPLFHSPSEGEERLELHPKKPSGYVGRPYWQVFRGKFGFVPNLSVMDLLFNEGPESLGVLRV